jgi:YHS domain-containing protein
MRPILSTLLVSSLFVAAGRCADEDSPAKEALQALNSFVGSWKGAGSNMSRSENWKESFSWSWKFKGDDAALLVDFKDSKDFGKGELRFNVDKKKYELKVNDKKGDNPKTFVGELKKGYLTLDHFDSKSGDTQRLTLNTAAEGIRFVYTLQRKPKGSTIYTKLYQVDFNKEGESLAGGGKENECVVTGGRGTIAVSYMGKTYYVCCTGCRDAFNENPEKILKEYAERKKKEK